MSRKTVRNTVLVITGLLVTWPSAAQNPNKFTYHMGAGFTEPARHSDSRLDLGFNITGGAGYNFAPWIGILGEFSYNQLGVSSAALAAFGAPQGSANMYSLTANPIVRLNPRGRYDAYAAGGGGFYRRTIEFTEPIYAMVTAFDPFFGILYPAAIPANA